MAGSWGMTHRYRVGADFHLCTGRDCRPILTLTMPLTPAWLKALLPAGATPSPRQRAKDLIAAIDAGGIPLNPARVNDIGRQLGLEVSVDAPMAETIERIRLALRQNKK